MKPEFIETRVLILVMTYPHPSQKHQELVCTAGITDSGEWVRLYPIDYRYLPNHQQFRKYQWIKGRTTSERFGKRPSERKSRT